MNRQELHKRFDELIDRVEEYSKKEEVIRLREILESENAGYFNEFKRLYEKCIQDVPFGDKIGMTALSIAVYGYSSLF